MNWNDLYAQLPRRLAAGIPVFGREADGDWFDEEDVAQWRSGRLAASWQEPQLLQQPAARRLAEAAAAQEACVIDLACGPGLGFLPTLNQLRPGLPAMAVDANLTLLQEWQQVLAELQVRHVAMTQCSLLALPFREASVPAYTSMIGLSSVRGGEADYAQALCEIYRTLVPGGRLYAVESEWLDVPSIVALFDRLGWQLWDVFRREQHTWRERFLQAGFTILMEEEAERRFLTPEDNELGAAAHHLGVSVGQRRVAYILQK